MNLDALIVEQGDDPTLTAGCELDTSSFDLGYHELQDIGLPNLALRFDERTGSWI